MNPTAIPKKVDIHTHILPPELPRFKEKYGYGGFIQYDRSDCGAGCRAGCGTHEARMLFDDGRFFRKVESNCWDPMVRIQECERHGVDHQVVSTVPVMFGYWAKPQDALDLSQFLNDHIASVVSEHPDRFSGLGTIPLQDPKLAVRELERCVKKLGLNGVQIGSHINKWNLDEPALFEVFHAAEELGAAVFVHPWDMMAQDRMPKYWLPWLVGMPAESSLAICSMIFGGVFERLPKLKVCFAHGGGSFAATLGRIDHAFHVRPDLCAVDNKVAPREYAGRFFVDSLVHDPLMLDVLIKTFGANRVALGTDYPFPLGELSPGELIESMKLDPGVKDQLLWKTAWEWLGK
jgi:aminocarboxymuconate-semialdehyde decarboxylase